VDVDVNISSMCCITGIFICIFMQEGVNVRLASGQMSVVFLLVRSCGHTKTVLSKVCMHLYSQRTPARKETQCCFLLFFNHWAMCLSDHLGVALDVCCVPSEQHPKYRSGTAKMTEFLSLCTIFLQLT
jgi:hypothetical protein